MCWPIGGAVGSADRIWNRGGAGAIPARGVSSASDQARQPEYPIHDARRKRLAPGGGSSVRHRSDALECSSRHELARWDFPTDFLRQRSAYLPELFCWNPWFDAGERERHRAHWKLGFLQRSAFALELPPEISITGSAHFEI